MNSAENLKKYNGTTTCTESRQSKIYITEYLPKEFYVQKKRQICPRLSKQEKILTKRNESSNKESTACSSKKKFTIYRLIYRYFNLLYVQSRITSQKNIATLTMNINFLCNKCECCKITRPVCVIRQGSLPKMVKKPEKLNGKKMATGELSQRPGGEAPSHRKQEGVGAEPPAPEKFCIFYLKKVIFSAFNCIICYNNFSCRLL